MIPFENCIPYDRVMNDIYVPQCPFCKADNVLLPMRPKELPDIRDGKKRLVIFPCCHARVTVIDTDSDYLLTNKKVPRT
ncbi:hypothetical protein ACFOQM_08980 [Paenibacillus sp. GCM10012307]|uniref:Uncharacterized protein n=1 Tax=Paenibacillus roseus TaxID=2798579 RepID=A0A934MQ10_9BACL|nr:hypothetical protein [Paenibacillus roseus]MBJ6361418.1 hypothetical protein [Paenibacillus roseus]